MHIRCALHAVQSFHFHYHQLPSIFLLMFFFTFINSIVPRCYVSRSFQRISTREVRERVIQPVGNADFKTPSARCLLLGPRYWRRKWDTSVLLPRWMRWSEVMRFSAYKTFWRWGRCGDLLLWSIKHMSSRRCPANCSMQRFLLRLRQR